MIHRQRADRTGCDYGTAKIMVSIYFTMHTVKTSGRAVLLFFLENDLPQTCLLPINGLLVSASCLLLSVLLTSTGSFALLCVCVSLSFTSTSYVLRAFRATSTSFFFF